MPSIDAICKSRNQSGSEVLRLAKSSSNEARNRFADCLLNSYSRSVSINPKPLEDLIQPILSPLRNDHTRNGSQSPHDTGEIPLDKALSEFARHNAYLPRS
jgi:hypothetical protein